MEASGNPITFDRDVRLTNAIPRWKRHFSTILTMEQYTPKQRAEIVQLYIENKFSIVLTKRAWKNKNKVKTSPGDNTIRRLYAKFISSGSVGNASHLSRQRPRRSDENIDAVRASVAETPSTSGRHRSQELGIARTTNHQPFVRENELDNYWFQQDGATCHTAAATTKLLREMFPGRLISKNGDYDWPPRSPDLTPPDFCYGDI